jgi:hypothetical protein
MSSNNGIPRPNFSTKGDRTAGREIGDRRSEIGDRRSGAVQVFVFRCPCPPCYPLRGKGMDTAGCNGFAAFLCPGFLCQYRPAMSRRPCPSGWQRNGRQRNGYGRVQRFCCIPLLPFLCTSVRHLASDHACADKGFRPRFSTKGMDTFVATFTLTFVASVAAELGAGETLA